MVVHAGKLLVVYKNRYGEPSTTIPVMGVKP